MFAGFQPATAERAQISANRHKSSDNLRSSTTPNTHSSPASPSNNSLHRLDPNQPDRPPRSNPHSTRGTASRSLKRGFLHCRLSDAGRQICGAVPQAAGFRNPKQCLKYPGRADMLCPSFDRRLGPQAEVAAFTLFRTLAVVVTRAARLAATRPRIERHLRRADKGLVLP